MFSGLDVLRLHAPEHRPLLRLRMSFIYFYFRPWRHASIQAGGRRRAAFRPAGLPVRVQLKINLASRIFGLREETAFPQALRRYPELNSQRQIAQHRASALRAAFAASKARRCVLRRNLRSPWSARCWPRTASSVSGNPAWRRPDRFVNSSVGPSISGSLMPKPRSSPHRRRGAACAPRLLCRRFPPARNRNAKTPSSSCRAPGSSRSARWRSSAFRRRAQAP
jgi:hypothetical protein